MQIGLNLYSAYKLPPNKCINKDSKPVNVSSASYSYPSVQNLKANIVPFMGKTALIDSYESYDDEQELCNNDTTEKYEYDSTPEERSFDSSSTQELSPESGYKYERHYDEQYEINYVKELKKLAANPKLKAEDQKALLTLYRTYKDSEDPQMKKLAYESRNVLASHLMKIVFTCTKKYYPHIKRNVSDLINEGIVGLYEAFDKVKMDKDVIRYDFYVSNKMINYISMNKKQLNIPYRAINTIKNQAYKEHCEAIVNDPSLAKNAKQLSDSKKSLGIISSYEALLKGGVLNIDDPEKKFDVPDKTEIVQILVDDAEKKEMRDDLLPLLRQSKRATNLEKNLEFILNYNGFKLSKDGKIEELEIDGDKNQYLADKFGYKAASLRETYSKLCQNLSKTPMYKKMAKKYFGKDLSIPTSDAISLAKRIKKGDVSEETKESFKSMILMHKKLDMQEKRFIIANYLNSNIKDEAKKFNITESWALRVAKTGLEKIEPSELSM